MSDERTNAGLIADTVQFDPMFAADRAAVLFVNSVCTAMRAMRKEAGLTQAGIAELLDVTQGRISQVESGLLEHAPNLAFMAEYAFACGQSLELHAMVSESAQAAAAV